MYTDFLDKTQALIKLTAYIWPVTVANGNMIRGGGHRVVRLITAHLVVCISWDGYLTECMEVFICRVVHKYLLVAKNVYRKILFNNGK